MKGRLFLLWLLGCMYIGLGVLNALSGTFAIPQLVVGFILWIPIGIAILRQSRTALTISLFSYPAALLITWFIPDRSVLTEGAMVVLASPFHALTYRIALTTATSTAAVVEWGIVCYALHLALVVPILKLIEWNPLAWLWSLRSGASRGIARRSSKSRLTFTFPEQALLYEKNPFRILGLDTGARFAEISKRANEASRLVGRNLPLPYIPVELPSAAPVSQQDVSEARACLEDVRKRFAHELLWFQLDHDHDRTAYSHLAEGEYDEARTIWEPLANAKNLSSQGGTALWNLAVLEHSLAIGAAKADGGKVPPKVWLGALKRWKRVCAEQTCWDHADNRAKMLKDPHVTQGWIHHCRRVLPERLLRVNLDIARAASFAENTRLAEHHIDIVRKSGFSAETIEGAFSQTFESELAGLRRRAADIAEAAPSPGGLTLCGEALGEHEFIWEAAGRLGLNEQADGDWRSESEALMAAIRTCCRRAFADSANSVTSLRCDLCADANASIDALNGSAELLMPSITGFGYMNTGPVREAVYKVVAALEVAQQSSPKLAAAAVTSADVMARAHSIMCELRDLAAVKESRKELEQDVKNWPTKIYECRAQERDMLQWVNSNLSTAREILSNI